MLKWYQIFDDHWGGWVQDADWRLHKVPKILLSHIWAFWHFHHVHNKIPYNTKTLSLGTLELPPACIVEGNFMHVSKLFLASCGCNQDQFTEDFSTLTVNKQIAPTLLHTDFMALRKSSLVETFQVTETTVKKQTLPKSVGMVHYITNNRNLFVDFIIHLGSQILTTPFMNLFFIKMSAGLCARSFILTICKWYCTNRDSSCKNNHDKI